MMEPPRHDAAASPFVFSFAPTISSGDEQSLRARAVPLQRYLERSLGRPVECIVLGSYAEVLAALREGRADAAMLGELATRTAEEGGGVEPLVAPIGANAEIPTYRSAIITRIDSGIHDLPALRGATIGLVDEQSTSGYLVPRAMLREAGLDPDRDLSTRLFGRHRIVADKVIAGEVVAGALHEARLKPPSLDLGPDYARLRVLARSRPIPLGPLVVRASLDEATRARLADAMIRVHELDPAAADVVIRGGHRFTTATRRANPTLKSIAALAGVSYATVSRVVNGSGHVATPTAARVNAIVKEIGYAPNGNARLLQGQQAPLVGFVTSAEPNGVDSAASRLVASLSASLALAGIPLVLCPVTGRLAESLFLSILRDRRLGALVVTAQHVDDPGLVALAGAGHTVFAVGVARAAPGIVVTTATDAAPTILAALNWPPAARVQRSPNEAGGGRREYRGERG